MASIGRPWLVLAVVLVGTFMAVLDVAIVNVAIPSIREDLHASFGEVQLVISAYTLTYASLLVTGGRLGDLLGRKRMFILGLALFSAASAACGLAPSSGVLIGARALQGIGGAMLYPQVLAIVQLTFVGDARTRALGIFGSVAGLAAVAGQVPHESDRLPIIRAQVDEMRRRQAAGLLPDDIDPSLLRLFAFALASYPRMLPQITRMTTGLAPDDPRFVAAWEKLLRRVGTQLERSNGVPTAFQPPTAGSSSVFS